MDKKIIPVALLVTVLCIMLTFADRPILESAYAQVSSVNVPIVVTSVSSTFLRQTNGNRYVAYDTTGANAKLQIVSSSNFALTTVNLPTLSNGKGYGLMDCSTTSTTCVVQVQNVGLNIFRLVGVSNAGSVLWNVSATASAIWQGGDAIRIFGSSVYVPTVCTGADTDRIIQVYSVSSGAFQGNIGDCAGTNWGANNIIDIYVSGSQVAVTASVTASTRAFEIWSTATGTRTCQGASTTLASPEGTLAFFNNLWWFVDGNDVVSKTTSCAVGATTITSANTGLTGVNSIGVSSSRGEFYVKSATSVAVMNTTSLTTLMFSVPCGDSGSTVRNLFTFIPSQAQIACIAVTADQLQIRILGSPDGGGSEEEFCAIPANQNLLTCRLASQDGSLASFSDLIGQSFGNATNNIFVQLGLVEEGSDIQTNGVGYGITLVGLGIMIAMFALASGMELNRIPTFVWFLGTLSVIGLSTGFGFVDPLWLIISILVIIALASAKVLSALEIGGFR